MDRNRALGESVIKSGENLENAERENELLLSRGEIYNDLKKAKKDNKIDLENFKYLDRTYTADGKVLSSKGKIVNLKEMGRQVGNAEVAMKAMITPGLKINTLD